jgi:hypothetical protein
MSVRMAAGALLLEQLLKAVNRVDVIARARFNLGTTMSDYRFQRVTAANNP